MDASPASIQPLQPNSSQPPSSANQQSASTSSTGPQIRSRITVVCAECKRLKLKCDRRAPCGSCTKRDTVVRCIYSPAAAEKVDLHSLNNRLIQVEATLALITSGQTTPAFQSAYPFALPPGANPSSSSSTHHQGSHQHHHHYAATPSHTPADTSISMSSQDLSSIWLENLDLGILLPSSTSSAAPFSRRHSLAVTSGYIKLEPSPVEVDLTHPRNNATRAINIDMEDSYRPLLPGSSSNNNCLPSRAPSPLNRNPQHMGSHDLSHPQSQQHRCSAQLLLPALSIYYPVPSIAPPGTSAASAAAFPHHPATSSATASSSSVSPPPPSASQYSFPQPKQQQTPMYSKPRITPALVALLPPLPTCKRLLGLAKEVFRVRPVPFEPEKGWSGFEGRCLALLGGSEGAAGNVRKERDRERTKEREKEKMRAAKRARQIYFGGIAGLQVPQQSESLEDDGAGEYNGISGGFMEDVREEEQSLPFFAMMCAVLAVGSYASPSPPSTPSHGSSSPSGFSMTGLGLAMPGMTVNQMESPAFFYALSQQALGVWDTHTSSSGSAEEGERMDYVLASLIGVLYLLLSGSLSSSGMGEEGDKDSVSNVNPVYPLVGKLVNAARGMGLGRDSPGRKTKANHERKAATASHGRGRTSHQANKEKDAEKDKVREDWKRLLWWDILFYDLFTADVMGHQPCVPSYSYTTKLPACAAASVSAHATDEDGDEQDTEDEDLDYTYEHGYGQNMAMHQDEYFDGSSKHRPISSVEGGCGSQGQDEDAYLGARCRLTQLAQTIKQRIAHPDCCCGYTLDQAASLEGEIRRWQAGLTPSLQGSASRVSEDAYASFDLSPFPDGGGDLDKPVVSAVLQAQSCELALTAHLLVLKVYMPFLRPSQNAPLGSSSPAARGGTAIPAMNLHASQAAVHAAQAVLRTAKILRASSLASSTPSVHPIAPSMLDFFPLHKIVFDAVIICAHAGISAKSTTPAGLWSFDVGALMEDISVGLDLLAELGLTPEPQRKILDAVCKKISYRGANAMKRKHDQVDLGDTSVAVGSTSSNGAAAGGEGKNIVTGFDFNNSNSGQYQHNGIPVAQQQQNAFVDLLPSAPSASVSSYGIHFDRQQQQQQQPQHRSPGLAAAIAAAASARRALHATEREKDKDKGKGEKQAKKSHVHPAVGIRVRPAKDGMPVVRSRTHSLSVSGGGQMQAPPPLMTSTPRPLPGADAVFAFQQQQKQKLQGLSSAATATTATNHSHPSSQTSSPGNMNTIHEQDPHRSRSSSIGRAETHAPQQPGDRASQSMDYTSSFGPSSGVHEMESLQPRHQRQHPSPQHQSFNRSPPMFDGAQPHPQAVYDQSQVPFGSMHGSSGAQVEEMSYTSVSSPFSNNSVPVSATSSPFTTTSSGHPPTPTFASHHPTPPVFGPLPTAASPTTYFQQTNGFDPSYGNSPSPSSMHTQRQQPMTLHDMGLDQNMITSVAGTPTYEKSQQQAMYDPKPAVQSMVQHHHSLQQQHLEHQHQQQHLQHQNVVSSYDDRTQSDQLPMDMGDAHPWPPPNHHDHSPMSPQNVQPFWNNGVGFKFYP
ncbi:hypothetical protein B0H34DRAFT_861342 [Crassisporium funariophilum]|nr:hypothetical protein B0H34DRAFT_861342 [Crassisporium funariophilum]